MHLCRGQRRILGGPVRKRVRPIRASKRDRAETKPKTSTPTITPYSRLLRDRCELRSRSRCITPARRSGSLCPVSSSARPPPPRPRCPRFCRPMALTQCPRDIFSQSNEGDGTDYDSCVLLDHIPHNDCCRPSLYDPSTYTPYTITVNIPNVFCERCSLHLSNPMTDKIGGDGSPSGVGCTDPGTCFSVYHSCTKPFRIVGDASNGAVPRSKHACPSSDSVNVGWPTSWMGDDGEAADASIPGVYRRISSTWSADDYTLTTAPAAYREDTGALSYRVVANRHHAPI